ncbi:retrovirus-related pol polyprotein from transposon TNT 1-94 [Tanacetum coccineum]
MCNKCLKLEAEPIKQHNMVEKDEYNRLSKRFSEFEQHCISIEIAMQLNKEIFQKNNTFVNQTEPSFDQLFELNNLKVELQAKDTTIEKLKANIKRLNKTSTTNSMKKDIDEIKTINIELDHWVTKLIADNEHLKQTYKQLYDSIKPSRVQAKEHAESLLNQLNQKKFKGKDIVDNAAQASNATTITPRMYKLDPIVEQSKSLNPLDSASYSTCKYVKLIQELLGYVRETCLNIHKPNEKLVAVTPINKKKTVSSMFDARHELCFLEFVSDMNASSKSISQVVQIVLWYLDFGCSKHMTRDRSQLTNLVHKFLGTVKFSNDQIAKIMGYGDYQIWNITISRVYYVEGLGHNLFSVGQFCDSDLEVAFRKHTCFVRNLEASKTKSWLWHRRLSHLNFGAINHLAKHGLVRGLPKLKFEKDHLCSAWAMGKSKKQSHKPKSEDTNQEKLYLLHMDLCRPMRIASVNGKKYIHVIVDDYSRFTWVKFLASKDEALDFIIKFLKMIQVRLNATVRNIRTDNGTEFVNKTLRDYYEHVGISHKTSVA